MRHNTNFDSKLPSRGLAKAHNILGIVQIFGLDRIWGLGKGSKLMRHIMHIEAEPSFILLLITDP